MLGRTGANRSFLVVETQKGPSMRFLNSIFANLLKPIDRREFRVIVERHDGDAYDKNFKSWDHLATLIFAQLSHVDTLRGLESRLTPIASIIIISTSVRLPAAPSRTPTSGARWACSPTPLRCWRGRLTGPPAAKEPNWCG